jgi:hypothetical protein
MHWNLKARPAGLDHLAHINKEPFSGVLNMIASNYPVCEPVSTLLLREREEVRLVAQPQQLDRSRQLPAYLAASLYYVVIPPQWLRLVRTIGLMGR